MAAGSPTSPVLDFTSLDYDSMSRDLTRFAQSQFGINLTNYNPSEPLVVFIGMMAYVTDLLSYTENQHTQEAIGVRARRMANFRDAVKPLGFTPKGPSPARTQLVVTFTPGEISAHSVTITPSHIAGTSSGIWYSPATTTVFPMGFVGTGLIDVVQGRTYTEVLASASPGTQSQTYTLSQSPILESSVRIIVDGVEWSKAASSVAVEGPSAQVYDIHFDDTWGATVVFGDGITGKIPPTGVVVSAIYATVAGEDGNVDHDQITTLVSMPIGVASVTNPDKAVDGAPAESLDSAKARLPSVARANDRAVSFSDCAAQATQVPGVAKAVAIRGISGTGGCGVPSVIYAAPEGGFSGGGLTPSLVSQIITRLRDKGMGGRRYFVRDAVFVDLSIELDVYVQSVASASDTKVLVQNEILDAYDFKSLNFGVTLPIQALYDLLTPTSVKGVARVFVRKFTINPSMGFYLLQTPTGNGTINTLTEGATLFRREFKVTVTESGGVSGPATFTVVERTLGVGLEVSDSSITDDTAVYEPNGLVGRVFRYRSYDGDSGTFNITGNTPTSLSLDTTTLQDFIQPNDEFCIERALVTPGKCYRDVYANGGGFSGGATVPFTGTGWAPGDVVRVTTATGVSVVCAVASGSSGAWVLSQAIPAVASGTAITMTAGYFTDQFYFEVLQGSRRWGVGDTFYIDTYPHVEDLVVRAQSYPNLTAENLVIRTIGGRA